MRICRAQGDNATVTRRPSAVVEIALNADESGSLRLLHQLVDNVLRQRWVMESVHPLKHLGVSEAARGAMNPRSSMTEQSVEHP